MKERFASVDTNSDGKVSFDELLAWSLHTDATTDDLLYSFACSMVQGRALVRGGYLTEKEATKGWVFHLSEWAGDNKCVPYTPRCSVAAQGDASLSTPLCTGTRPGSTRARATSRSVT